MAKFTLHDLLYLMERLRDPKDGCPWDQKQSWASIVPSTLEEAYEVADAIERQEYPALGEELGDLLFQVVFYAQLGREQEYFDFGSIVDGLVGKLLRRHPHVFPDGTLDSRRSSSQLSETDIKQNWESIKKHERKSKGQLDLFADVPLNLPSLSRAQKLQKRAANIGFDWPDIAGVMDKVEEELSELKVEIEAGDKAAIEHELGDLLFSVVNLCRHLKVDAEGALRHCSQRFEKRFELMEKYMSSQGTSVEQVSLSELENAWNQAKSELKHFSG